MVKRECFSTIGCFDENYIVDEDFEFFLRLIQKYKAGVVRKKLFLRRVFKNSLSRQNFERNATYDIQILKNFIANNKDFYKKNRKILKMRMADLYFIFGYRYLRRNMNLKAFIKFLQATKCYPQIKILKKIRYCAIPPSLRYTIKSIMSRNTK